MNLNDTLIHLLSVNGRGGPRRWSSHAQDRLPSIRRLKEEMRINLRTEEGSPTGAVKQPSLEEDRTSIARPVRNLFWATDSNSKADLARQRAAAADEIYELSEPPR